MSDRMQDAWSSAVERYDFLWHLAIYLVVNGGLVGIWAFEWIVEGVQDIFWPIFPIAIWGIFVLGHYLSAYGESGDRWIEAEAARILRNQD